MPSTRVGYVGVDHHHRDPYFQVAERLPVDLVALCEPGEQYTAADIQPMQDRPDEIAAEGADTATVAERADIYADPHRMIAEADLDVVWITYRNDTVPAIVETAADNGVDVLSEKPIARTASDLETAADRARDAGITVGATYFYRYNPIAQELKDRVADGFFGDIWSVDGRYVGSKLDYRGPDHYLYDPAASRGGSLQWIGLHWVDLVMYVLDDPIARVCARTEFDDLADVEAGTAILYETASGITGTFQTGYYLSDPIKDSRFGIYGTEATADTPLHNNGRGGNSTVPLDLRSDRDGWVGTPGRELDIEFSYDRFPAWGDYVLDFFGDYFAGRASGDIPADLDDALLVLRVLDAAYESVESDGWVEVDIP